MGSLHARTAETQQPSYACICTSPESGSSADSVPDGAGAGADKRAMPTLHSSICSAVSPSTLPSETSRMTVRLISPWRPTNASASGNAFSNWTFSSRSNTPSEPVLDAPSAAAANASKMDCSPSARRPIAALPLATRAEPLAPFGPAACSAVRASTASLAIRPRFRIVKAAKNPIPVAFESAAGPSRSA